MMKEMLNIPTVTPLEREVFKKYQDRLDQMQALSPEQMAKIKDRYEHYKKLRKIVRKPPYFRPPSHDGNEWDQMTDEGLKKAVEFLFSDTLVDAMAKVANMSMSERIDWLHRAAEEALKRKGDPE